MIEYPDRHFSRLFRANEKYTQQAYALVTRDPPAAEAAAKAWRRAETDGRVRGEGRPSGKLGNFSLVSNPRKHFSELYDAGSAGGRESPSRPLRFA